VVQGAEAQGAAGREGRRVLQGVAYRGLPCKVSNTCCTAPSRALSISARRMGLAVQGKVLCGGMLRVPAAAVVAAGTVAAARAAGVGVVVVAGGAAAVGVAIAAVATCDCSCASCCLTCDEAARAGE
jgi:hypothetical protein